MAVNRPEAPDKSRPDLKGLWLLPIFVLGLGTLIVTRKKIAPPRRPTKAELSKMAKHEAFRYAKYLVMSQMLQEHSKAVIVTGFAPENDDEITELAPNRFRCSGFLTAHSPTGIPLREGWQCIVTGSQASWNSESLQQSGWKRVSPHPAAQDAVETGNDGANRQK